MGPVLSGEEMQGGETKGVGLSGALHPAVVRGPPACCLFLSTAFKPRAHLSFSASVIKKPC